MEDHPATREGLRNGIGSQADMQVVGEAGTCREALTLARRHGPEVDVLVLDLNLPDGNGWTLLKQLRQPGPLPRTLVLSVCAEAVYARRLLRAGARGYLMKDEPIERVLQGIRDLHAGLLVVSPAIASQWMAEVLELTCPPAAAEPLADTDELSDRELQVVGLLARHLTNKEVAAHLGLSEKTVHTYKTRLMIKLGVSTTPELLARFREGAF